MAGVSLKTEGVAACVQLAFPRQCAVLLRGVVMIAEPIISPDFTIEDIHKIREYHYELTKDMTVQEKIAFYNEGGRAFLEEMNKRKQNMAVKS